MLHVIFVVFVAKDPKRKLENLVQFSTFMCAKNPTTTTFVSVMKMNGEEKKWDPDEAKRVNKFPIPHQTDEQHIIAMSTNLFNG